MEFDFGNAHDEACNWYEEYLQSKGMKAMKLEFATWSKMVAFAGDAITGVQTGEGGLAAIININEKRPAIAREGDFVVCENGKFSVVKAEDFEGGLS